MYECSLHDITKHIVQYFVILITLPAPLCVQITNKGQHFAPYLEDKKTTTLLPIRDMHGRHFE